MNCDIKISIDWTFPDKVESFYIRETPLFDSNSPFTAEQLKALVTKDEFEVINWPDIFEVKPTSFERAIEQTFKHPSYSQVVLDF